jgi:hypothetical protein
LAAVITDSYFTNLKVPPLRPSAKKRKNPLKFEDAFGIDCEGLAGVYSFNRGVDHFLTLVGWAFEEIESTDGGWGDLDRFEEDTDLSAHEAQTLKRLSLDFIEEFYDELWAAGGTVLRLVKSDGTLSQRRVKTFTQYLKELSEKKPTRNWGQEASNACAFA